ncbi:50S ribosome-binding GTPase [Candidatus Woesearchaeota archaeon]|nr:50S ribosome-binding GTPase [Candidatus Woesearchaeota archaeon]
MNFQGLGKVETADKYIDIAFARANDAANLDREKISEEKLSNPERSKHIEMAKVDAIADALRQHLSHILIAFPKIDDLPEFYQQLVKCTLEYSDLKHALGAVNWADKRISDFRRFYTDKIKRTRDFISINGYRKEYYGRVSSVIKKIKKELEYLEKARKILREFPQIKTSMPTIAICGFPNVGKTTLLYKLTGSKPEISSYAFTTKSINVAYLEADIKFKKKKFQLLDTPGTLNRFNKMNNIEKQAFLAIKYLANTLVYVFDLAESFPLEDQKQLFFELQKFEKPMVVYMSKQDVIDKPIFDAFISDFLDKNKIKYYDIDALKKMIIKSDLESNSLEED